MTDQCKLCLNSTKTVGNLHNSHVIPKFMLKMSKSKNGRAIIFDSDGRPRERQFDWHQKLFCSACESQFKFYEDFMKETLFLHRKKKVLVDSEQYLVFSGSNDLMAISLLSIFWRAAESTLPEFRFMMLPESLSSAAREWIHTGRLPVNWQRILTVKLSKIIGPDGEPIRLIITPRVRQTPGKFEFALAFGGYFIELALPPDSTEANGRFSLRRGSTYIRAKKTQYNLIPEISYLLEWKNSLLVGRQ